MILVIGGIKGGSGKTTLATNLTSMRSATGKKVLLVDADEQKSSSDWVDQRLALGFETNWTTIQLSGKSIYSQIQKLSADFDDIIVDVGGRDTTSQRSALTVADKFLIPFKPRCFDIWTLGSVRTLINEVTTVNRSLKSFALVNQADSKGTDNSDAYEMLSEFPEITPIPHSIGQRKAFSNAASDGLSIYELKVKDSKASQEMSDVYSYLFNLN